ncbi:heterokaryon incompatibility protein-domain-containing protein [Echria macrotheca]|uniref:Heterokaryon incompatibility protein-domain-containing protein n=1 Tax=Echria macrotheca TaxID=438768 RepID=A0AAJ0B6N8_9PEZI|nr:heterokaryon incompatibility protein-domain-containing protein [Echria macrotheca]
MAESNPEYPYRPLNIETQEIRLLSLNPLPDGSCSLSLIHRTLDSDNPPVYLALSYVWGDATDTAEILVDGVQLKVTKNLASALKRLKRQFPGEHIWIDAVCINQLDTAERNAQVGVMGRIYSHAKRVLVWMGDEPDHGALAKIQQLGRSYRGVISAAEWGDFMEENRFLEAMSDPANRPEFDRLCAFFERPWWKRVWVIQELVLARDARFFCGHEEDSLVVPWEDVKGCLELLEMSKITSSSPDALSVPGRMAIYVRVMHTALGRSHLTWTAGQYRERTGRGESGLPLFEALFLISYTPVFVSGGLQAKDPRDMVYGLLGIVRDEDRRRIPLDYSTSMDFPKLLIHVSKILLMDCGPRLFLACKPTSSSDIPSWVLGLTAESGTVGIIERAALTIMDGVHDTNPVYRPSAGIRWQDWSSRCRFSSLSHGRAVATLPGVVTPSCVSRVGSVFTCLKTAVQFPDACRDFLLELSEMVKGVGTEEYLENVWRVPIALPYDRSRRRSGDPLDEDEASLVHGFDLLIEGKAACPELPGMTAAKWQAFLLRCRLNYTRRWKSQQLCSFIDEMGRPGVGPRNVAVGDRIAIFAGGYAPFIVREEIVGDETFYRLVGSTYVYGLMEGEALDGGVSFEDISLV